jgi:hypothetical protein
MSNYSGPATVTLADGTRRIGTAVLHTIQHGGRLDWRGTFRPNGGSPVSAGEATIEVGGRSASVLIQDWQFDGTRGTAVLLGQDQPPI